MGAYHFCGIFPSSAAFGSSSHDGSPPRSLYCSCRRRLTSVLLLAERAVASAGLSRSIQFRPLSGRYWCLDALKSCAAVSVVWGAEQVHCYLVKAGGVEGISLHNHLLKVYLRRGRFRLALKLLDEMPYRNLISWNTVVSGFVDYCPSTSDNLTGVDHVGSHARGKDLCFSFLGRMMLELVRPDHITFAGIFRACTELNSVLHGELALCVVIKLGFSSHCFVGTAVVDMYAKLGLVEDARSVFDEISDRDLVLWNVMISCYALNGLGEEAFKVFALMRLQGLLGDPYTLSSLLNSSSSLKCIDLGKQIHGVVIKLTPNFDLAANSALVDMYGKCGDVKSARKAFDLTSLKNIVLWNSIIVTYGKSGDGQESTKLLREMLRRSMRPDELTLSSTLSSCCKLVRINEVLQIHNHAVKSGLEGLLSIGNALVGAYAKCGDIYSASLSFSLISKPDVIAWTSMISACAFHGLGKEALEVYEKMLCSGVTPDDIVFLEVLSACSHCGLVDAGISYFVSMVKANHIKPSHEHYTCLLDLLGRAGLLDDAYSILRSLHHDHNVSNLGAFLGACKLHGDVKLAKWAGDLLFSLQPSEPINFILMSNVYASVECRHSEQKVRNIMRSICKEKVQGCSWIEITHSSQVCS